MLSIIGCILSKSELHGGLIVQQFVLVAPCVACKSSQGKCSCGTSDESKAAAPLQILYSVNHLRTLRLAFEEEHLIISKRRKKKEKKLTKERTPPPPHLFTSRVESYPRLLSLRLSKFMSPTRVISPDTRGASAPHSARWSAWRRQRARQSPRAFCRESRPSTRR